MSHTHWPFTGQHTTGQVTKARDGLVMRYRASNSNGLISMHSSPERAARWLRNNDKPRG